MARRATRWGLAAMVAGGVRGALNPGGPSLGARLGAVPRMVGASLRGDYHGLGWSRLAALAAAVAYVVSPVDLMPEAFLTVLGLADDAVVVAWIVAALVSDTEDFLAWEGAAASSGTGGSSGTAPGAGGPQDRASDGPQDAPSGTRGPTVTSHVVP